MSETVVPFPRRTAPGGSATDAAPGPSCPICGKAEVPRFRPFCSQRCARIDLGRWLGERYRIPAGEAPGDEGTGSEEEER